MGGGHGTYFFGKLFYPIPMIIAGVKGRITDLAMWLAIFQIPFYGFILHLARHEKRKMIGLGILLIHIVLFFISMNIANGFN